MHIANIYQLAGTVATILSVIAFIPYIIAIMRNKTRPSGASWWTWSILAFITVVSSRASGAPWQVLILPMWLGISQLGVAILSIKRGDNNWDLLNKACVGSALVGMGLWLVTGNPLIALSISIVTDFMASIPNFRHVWKNPEQENWMGWTLGFGSAILEIFAVQHWSLAESGWAVYFLINMGTVLILVSRPMFRNFFRKI